MKGILAFAVLLSLVAVSGAQGAKSSSWSDKRKYDFTIEDSQGKKSHWGSYDDFEKHPYKSKGPGIYVAKDGGYYYIADKATLAQAQAAQKPMESIGAQMKIVGHEEGKHAKADQKYVQRQKEIGRQMAIASKEFGDASHGKAPSPEASKKFSARMKELSAQMREVSKQQFGWSSEFGKKMSGLGQQMKQAAHVANDKITVLIDNAFAKSLAKKIE